MPRSFGEGAASERGLSHASETRSRAIYSWAGRSRAASPVEAR